MRDEITELIKSMGLQPQELHEVGKSAYMAILEAIVSKFTVIRHHKYRANLHWAWERLKPPTGFMAVNSDSRAMVLERLIEDDVIWFIAEDDQEKMWVYEGSKDAVLRIIEELGGILREYYLVSNKFEWLLVEDHHQVLHGGGADMVHRMNRIKEFVL